jgi:hypothetical protein
MPRIAELVARKAGIVEEIGKIQTMRKGTLSAIYQKVVHKDGEVVRKGPYYRLSRKGKNNKTVSWSIPTQEAARVQEEVDNYRHFRQLTDEYVDVCEELATLSASQSQDDAKKN